MSDTRISIGGVTVNQWSKGGKLTADFHAETGLEVKHSEKKEADPETGSHGCHEYNTVKLTNYEGTEFTLFLSTEALVELIEKGAEALTGCREVGVKF